jgi:PKD repeat protein
MKLNRPAVFLFLLFFPVMTAVSAMEPPPKGTVTPPSFLRSMFYGRIQEIRASDKYLVVHSIDGDVHKVTCLNEPAATFAWEKTYRSMSSPHNIHISGDRVAVIAAAGDPAKTVGLHIYNAANGAETAYFRDAIFAASGNHIVGSSSSSGEIFDLTSGTKIFAYAEQHRTRLKAVIGDHVLYLVSEGADERTWFPILVSLPGVSESWRGITFAGDVLDFISDEITASDEIVRDGFPALLSGKPRTRAAEPFKLLLLDVDGRARLFTPTDFDIPEPTHSVAVDFSYAWQSGTARGVAAGLNTAHLRKTGAYELVIVSLDSAGTRRGRTSLSLRDNRVLWSGYAPGNGILLLMERFRPKSAYVFVCFRLPDLVQVYEKELGFLRATPGPGRLIGDEAFITGSTAVNEGTVFSLKTADGGLSAFYPFPEKPYFLDKSPDDVFGVFNSRHLFIAMNNRDEPKHTMVYRIPRGYSGWFDGTLVVPSPVYTNTPVNVTYSPAYGILSASGGSLSGAVWTTPAIPGSYTITLSIGTAVKECSVEVVEPPPNVPPTADFKLLDPSDSVMWQGIANFDASTSRDADGRIVNYAWDFGDSIKVDGADTIRPAHFAIRGTYDVTLTVTDDKGATAQKKRKVVLGRTLSYRDPWYPGVGIPAALASGTTANYEFQILSGGQDGAGTNATVCLALFGPKDSEGMRSGSGEFDLDATTAPLKTDPFEQNSTDVFSVPPPGNLPGIKPGWNLNDVEFLTLRHNNTGDRPGWYCYGIRVTNQKNGKVWVFVPDQWLDFHEGPDSRVWYKFFRVDEAYPGGIYFGGSGNPRCEGLVQASDNIFILSSSMTKFFFTMLDRSRALEVKKDGVLIGTASLDGSGTLDPKFLRKTEWGVAYQASLITRPTKFDLTIGSGSGAKESVVWVFPSTWADHPDLARKAALALPLKGNLGAFDYGTKAKSFLQGQTVDIAAALAPIINYGSEALAIFGDIPDLTLESYAETAVTQYVDLRLALIAVKLGVELTFDMTSTIKDLLTSIKKALEWASGMGDAISEGQAAVYASPLLQNMATDNKDVGNSSFLIAVDMLHVLKGTMEALVTAAEGNDVSAFQTDLNTINAIVLGNTAGLTPQQIQAAPDSTYYYINYATYGISHVNPDVTRGFPLLLELVLQLRMVEKVWKPRVGYAHYFHDPSDVYDLEANLSTNEKKNATVTAMETYGPIIRDMIKIAGLAADIVLMN